MASEVCPLLEEAIKFANSGKPDKLAFFAKKCAGCEHLVRVSVIKGNRIIGEKGQCGEGFRLVYVNGVLGIFKIGCETNDNIRE